MKKNILETARIKCSEWIQKKNSAPIGKLDWILLGVMAVFMFFTMFYTDLQSIYNQGLNFWDCLIACDMGNFYTYSLEHQYAGFAATYYWIVYAVIGIWNLPIWILRQAFGINVYSVKCMLWSKLQMVFFLVLTLWMLEKIMRDFGFEKKKCRFAQFLFASSLMVILPTVAISQIDIITVFLMLWGIREYLKSERITWKFLLIFAFASALKIFAMFVFIPLVMLREKRILAVVGDLAVGTVFILASLLPYAGRADYLEATSVLNDVMVDRMFETVFPTGNLQIPAFLTIFVGICIWAYVTKIKSKEKYLYYVNWIALAVFAVFFIFVFAHPYWILLLAPYVVLLIMMNPERMKINMLLTFFMEVAVTIVYCGTFGVYMTENNFADLVLTRLGMQPLREGYFSFGEWATQNEWEPYLATLFGIFAACLVALLILNRPGKVKTAEKTSENISYSLEWKEHVKEELEFDHGMIYLRLGMILAYILGCVYFAYIN